MTENILQYPSTALIYDKGTAFLVTDKISSVKNCKRVTNFFITLITYSYFNHLLHRYRYHTTHIPGIQSQDNPYRSCNYFRLAQIRDRSRDKYTS